VCIGFSPFQITPTTTSNRYDTVHASNKKMQQPLGDTSVAENLPVLNLLDHLLPSSPNLLIPQLLQQHPPFDGNLTNNTTVTVQHSMDAFFFVSLGMTLVVGVILSITILRYYTKSNPFPWFLYIPLFITYLLLFTAVSLVCIDLASVSLVPWHTEYNYPSLSPLYMTLVVHTTGHIPWKNRSIYQVRSRSRACHHVACNILDLASSIVDSPPTLSELSIYGRVFGNFQMVACHCG